MQFPTLSLVKGKLCFRAWLFSLLKVDWVDVEYTDESQQKDTNVFGIDLKLLQQLVSLMNKCSFEAALTVLLNLHKTHIFEYLVEKHVVYLVLSRGRDVQSFDDPIVLFNKLLGNVSLVVEIWRPTWHIRWCLILTLDTSGLLLPPQCVLIQ